MNTADAKRVPAESHKREVRTGLRTSVVIGNDSFDCPVDRVPPWLLRLLRVQSQRPDVRVILENARRERPDPDDWSAREAFTHVMEQRGVPFAAAATFWRWVTSAAARPEECVPAEFESASPDIVPGKITASIPGRRAWKLPYRPAGDQARYSALLIDLESATENDVIEAFRRLRRRAFGRCAADGALVVADPRKTRDEDRIRRGVMELGAVIRREYEYCVDWVDDYSWPRVRDACVVYFETGEVTKQLRGALEDYLGKFGDDVPSPTKIRDALKGAHADMAAYYHHHVAPQAD